MTTYTHYQKLKPEEVDTVWNELQGAWQNPDMPRLQYEACVKRELEDLRRGKLSTPYATIKTILASLPRSTQLSLLDVGASSGFYGEVLRRLWYGYDYTAMDFSEDYRDFACKLYPAIKFKVGSALDIPFPDKSFGVVLHGAVLMHLRDIDKAISEAARVSSEYVIFHRTPVFTDDTPTTAFVKEAYGVPCVEWHFNEMEIVRVFMKHGLKWVNQADVFMDGNFGHRSYLLAV